MDIEIEEYDKSFYVNLIPTTMQEQLFLTRMALHQQKGKIELEVYAFADAMHGHFRVATKKYRNAKIGK